MSRPLEHDYIGLAENPPMEISDKIFSSSSSLNLKETELRLGLPGCESPERKSATVVSLFGKDLQKNKGNLKNLVAGAKRGFCEAINDGCCGKWVFSVSDNAPQVDLGKGACFFSPIVGLEGQNNNTHNTSQSAKAIQDNKPEVDATKAQVVGWPPIRSFRRNTMACNLTKTNEEEAEGKAGSCSCLYVKVSMDGAPYLRKIDLKNYTNYMQLSSALEKMFTCFTIGQCSSGGVPGKDGLSESSLKDLLHGSEYVLTYEDKDGDWMLVGDVPWEMFIASCRRLRIMKGSEATGLAMEKSRSQN